MAVVNGLEVKNITKMVEAVKANPGMAQAIFSATTSWENGLHNQATVASFKLAGTNISHSKTFIVEGDHPKELLGTGQGPTSVEVLLASLGHCIAGGWAVYGATLGVGIDDLKIEVEGDVDLQGMLGLPEPGRVRPGFQSIRVTHYVKSKAPKEKLEQVKKMAEDLSPTKDSLRAINYSSKLLIQ